MKSRIDTLFVVLSLIASIGFLTGRAAAQTFTTLYNFTGSTDGSNPQNGVILSGGTLYGMANGGGSGQGFGTVFSLNTNGGSFATLHSFPTGGDNYYGLFTNSDGGFPDGKLILFGGTLYGAATYGGAGGAGTLFAINTNGNMFTVLRTFTPIQSNPTNVDGADPNSLIISGNTLYGTTRTGGSGGDGVVFAINTNGGGFTVLHNFTAMNLGTNSDGAEPLAALVLSGGMLYGTTAYGGYGGNGTVFVLNTNGSGFTTLHSFTAPTSYSDYGYFNSDGGSPMAGLLLSGAMLYGTTDAGGDGGVGTVFALNTNGSGFITLHSFTAPNYSYNGNGINSDGANPYYSDLILSSNTLCGTTEAGGSNGNGTVFAVSTDGSMFTVLHSFTERDIYSQTNSDGCAPRGGVIMLGNTLYGTAVDGGNFDDGTVFALMVSPPASTPPILAITSSGTNVLLTWPTNATGFTLQTTTNLTPQVSWSNVSIVPVILNSQNTVTNPVSGKQQFFRLSQ